MRRLALLIAVGTLWLFLAALPALADGGPHVAADNSGVSTLTADGCAGCHRAHTASAPLLLVEEAPDLCTTCHGAASTGATTDVMTGVQYAVGTDDPRGTVQLGALRGGGFDQARIDAGEMVRLSYLRNATAVSNRPKVGVTAAPEDVTSAHIALPENGLAGVLGGKAWGNGAAGSGAGPVATVTCTSCHNPHGNGQYRILNTIPHGDAIDETWVVTLLASEAATDRIYAQSSTALQPDDVVTIAGNTSIANGTYTVAVVNNTAGFGTAANYAWFTLVGLDITADGTGGTATRTSGVPVMDASLPAAGDARNYTVMQVKGTEDTEATYLLYASQVTAAAGSGSFNGIAGDYTATGGDYFARGVPWNPAVNNPACDPATFPVPAACSTANSAPNGRPSTFSGQITAWCASCHTRYFADKNPNTSTTDPVDVAQAWNYPRPGDSLFMYQHRTVPGRDCLTCHVSHGSNAAMDGDYSGDFPYPDATTSQSSRLLKVDNRGTCQACHDPTETVEAGTYLYYSGGLVVSQTTPPYDFAPVP